jgi:outer membrane protein, multidrug efflux system
MGKILWRNWHGWLLAVLVSGCAVGPNYHRPAVPAPGQFQDSSNPVATNSLADLPWWELFNDPTLTNLIHVALTNNYDVRIAATRVEQARALAAQARSQLFPQVGYNASGYRGKNALDGQANPAGGGNTMSSFEAALNASWEIDLWGRVRRLTEAARAQYLGTEEARRGVQLSLITDVASDYFQILELDEELRIAEETTNSFGRSLTLFSQRLGGGVASKLETDSAEGELAAVAAEVPDLQQRIKSEENQLNVLLGLPSEGLIRGTNGLVGQVMPPEVPAGLPSALLERRPDIRQAEEAVHSAAAQVGVATAAFFPQIGLTALFGGVSEKLSDLANPGSRLWSAGVNASGPLFQAGLLSGEYRQYRAFWDETILQYQNTALQAFQEVSAQLFRRLRYAEARTQLERAVAAYQDAVNVATERYRAGHANYFEVLNAQQVLYPQQNALAQMQLNQLEIVLQLYKSLGGGWNEPDIAGPTEK